MRLGLRKALSENYFSASQRARVLTEDWFSENIFCPGCEAESLIRLSNNNPASDFSCIECGEEFELKSSQKLFGLKVIDGSFRTMNKRLKAIKKPSLSFLTYALSSYSVTDLFVVPGSLLSYEMIEKRNPLRSTARRAGWVGCNILLVRIPSVAKVFYIRDSEPVSMSDVRRSWRVATSLQHESIGVKGWLLQVMRCVEMIQANPFHISDIYAFEGELMEIYPNNKNIQAKIRQQLQLLRDRGHVEFLGQGIYRRIQKATAGME